MFGWENVAITICYDEKSDVILDEIPRCPALIRHTSGGGIYGHVIILTITKERVYPAAVSVRFCFLIFSTRVVLLMLSSFAAFVFTQLLFSKASRISRFS